MISVIRVTALHALRIGVVPLEVPVVVAMSLRHVPTVTRG
jgi:hypothetical protein